VVKGFQAVVETILTKTADHYEAVALAIAPLAKSDTKIALEVIAKLNTSPRREAALVKFVEAVASEPPEITNCDAMASAYGKIKSPSMQALATNAALKGIRSRKQDVAPFIARVISLREWIKAIPDAEDKCQALCSLSEILTEHKAIVATSLFDALNQELSEAWGEVDLGWSKENTGFKIVALMSKSSPDISRDFLAKTELTASYHPALAIRPVQSGLRLRSRAPVAQIQSTTAPRNIRWVTAKHNERWTISDRRRET
jgi:hypothetical protein